MMSVRHHRCLCRRLYQTVAISLLLVFTWCMYTHVVNKRNNTLRIITNIPSVSDSFYINRSNSSSTGVLGRLYESLNAMLKVIRQRKYILGTNRELTAAVKFFNISRAFEDINCAAIVSGDAAEINNAITMNYNGKDMPIALEPAAYMNMTEDCADFTNERNYITSPLTQEEYDFPIAYSILMYTDIEQFERLLRTIYRPQNLYCIHVDLGAKDDLFQAVAAIAGCFPNVYLTENRVRVVWGQMSVLEPELLCMQLLHTKSKLWKYFINLTGQEFPLRTNYELVKILKAYDGANDVEGTLRRANQKRWAKSGSPPHGIIPTKGQVHAILSRGFVEYALFHPKAKEFLKWVERTEVPDETFFASLNHNPQLRVPGAYTGVPETDDSIKPYLARYKNWGDYPCRGKFVRGICIFGVGDLPVLARRPELFANKFMWGYQHAGYQCLEELLFNRTREEFYGRLDFDASVYGSLGFVVNQIRPGQCPECT